MIIGDQTEARAPLSSTIIDFYEPFDQGFKETIIHSSLILRQTICLDRRENVTKRIAKAERSRDFLPEM